MQAEISVVIPYFNAEKTLGLPPETKYFNDPTGYDIVSPQLNGKYTLR